MGLFDTGRGLQAVQSTRLIQIPAGLAEDVKLPPRAKAAYLAVAAAGRGAGVSTDEVAHLSGLSWVTAQRAIKDLQEAGWMGGDRTIRTSPLGVS